MRTALVSLLSALAFIAIPSSLAVVTLPYTFTAGQSIEASKVNANDQALRDGINTHTAATNPHGTTLAQILSTGNSCGANSINFNGTQAVNFEVENLAADPACAAGSKGRLIWNTVDSLFKICNGTSYVSIAGSGVNTLTSVLTAGNSAGALDLDMNGNEITNLRLENRTADGASVEAGRVFYRTDTSELKVCSGSSCTALGGAQGLESTLAVDNSAGAEDLDMNGNEIIDVRAEQLASDPGGSSAGRFYYNTDDDEMRFYNGSDWETIGNTQTLADVLSEGNSAGSTNIDVNLNQLLEMRVENLASSPGTGNAGRMYYDTGATKLMYAEAATNRAVVAEDKTQTLTNKSMSGSSNTFTNIPDSALSSNVVLKDGVQTITGAKTYSTGKITASDISTPSGGKHAITDGLSNDTFTLLNATQTLNNKSFGSIAMLGQADFNLYQAVEFKLENRGTDPAPGNAGRMYYKTSTGEIAYDDGTNIRVLTASGAGATTPWILGGNEDTDDTTDFIGTTDAQDFVMISDDNEILRLTTGGVAQVTGSVTVSDDLTVTDDATFLGELIGSLQNDTATGADQTLSKPTKTAVRLTDASLTSIQGIAAGDAGQLVTFTNATGGTVAIKNQVAGEAAANRIITGAPAGDINLSNNASLLLLYDGTSSRWRIVGASAPSASDVVFDDSTSALGATNVQDAIDATVVLLDDFVVAPGSSTDNAVVRYNGTTGRLVKDSSVTIADDTTVTSAGAVYAPAFLSGSTYTDAIRTNVPGDTASIGVATRRLFDSSEAEIIEWSSGVEFTQLTATTVPYLDGSKKLVSSDVTPTELDYLDGVTSNIQTQLDAVALGSRGTGTFTGTAVTPTTRLDQTHLYTGGSVQTFSGFGTIASMTDGTRITIIGSSDTNYISLAESDAADGWLMNGPMDVTRGRAITFEYNSTVARMVEISRN